MRAVVLRELEGPDALRCEEVPAPEPGPGEVLVRLDYAALNRRDLFISRGEYPRIQLPAILGSDGAGTVLGTGIDVDSCSSGDAVVLLPSLCWGDDESRPGPNFNIVGMPTAGTLAELITVPAENVFPRPPSLTAEEAAALPLAALTAWRAAVAYGGIAPGDKVLIPAIGGGVATFCAQIASKLGAAVYVTSGSDEKLRIAGELGVTGGVNHHADGWTQGLRDTAGRFDVVLDGVGGAMFSDLVGLVRSGGRIVSYGATAGPVPGLILPRIFLREIKIFGTTMGTAADFRAMLDFYERHGLRPAIAGRFELADIQAACRFMDAPQRLGKVVVKCQSTPQIATNTGL
jgi:zinc-binding alcohol dehydrogenase/oxidoreductase